MAKTTAPLFGFDARGQIGRALVFADWKGRSYARRYVTPANPQSTEQTLTRDTFDFLNNVWKYAVASITDSFNAYATGKVLTGRNAFIQSNLPVLRVATDLSGFIFSRGARSGIAPASMTLTPASGQITVDLTAPSLPTGWTITQAEAAAIEDNDPQTSTVYTMTTGNDASSPYSIVLSGLTNGQAYRVGGWFTFTRPDGATAYGPSLDDAATPA